MSVPKSLTLAAAVVLGLSTLAYAAARPRSRGASSYSTYAAEGANRARPVVGSYGGYSLDPHTRVSSGPRGQVPGKRLLAQRPSSDDLPPDACPMAHLLVPSVPASRRYRPAQARPGLNCQLSVAKLLLAPILTTDHTKVSHEPRRGIMKGFMVALAVALIAGPALAQSGGVNLLG